MIRKMSVLQRLMLLKMASGGGLSEYEVTGNPAVFNTNAATPLRQLLIPFSPVQTGTGDPSPSNVRPIAGWTGVNVSRTGKNLLDNEHVTISEMKVYNSGGGEVEKSGFIIRIPAGTYTLKCNSETVTAYIYTNRVARDGSLKEYAALSATSAGGWRTVTYTLDDGDYIIVYAGTTSGISALTSMMLQVELGDTASTYEEYVGTTIPVTFPALGKNLFDKNAVTNNVIWWKGEKATGYSDYCATEKIPVTPGEDYKLIRDAGQQTYVSLFDSEGNYTGTHMRWPSSASVQTIPEGVYFIGASMLKSSVDTAILTKGSEEVPYDPYTNTAYGGTLDLTTGVLTVGMGHIASYNGETLSGEWISDRDIYAPGTSPTIGAEVAYELDEPLEFQLTPEEIQTIIGVNAIYTDTNGQNTVKYLKRG